MQTRVLVVSASMGAGHDGAARELVRRLKAEGHEAEMRDFLTSAPLRIGDLLRSSYEFQMKYVAWSYDLTYRMLYRWPVLCPPFGMIMGRLTGPSLLQWAGDYEADVIVSTYPLTSVVLGRLRQASQLDVPTINFITDFGVHPLWTHPGIDLNLAVHAHSAALAEANSGRPSVATGPMVSPRFAEPHDRTALRERLGLSPDDRAVLIVAGSWGVGQVAKTFRTIADSRRFVPIAVCGRDERLRERLGRISGGRALGWTDDMPGLMAATDVLVENAGGLTAMEALSVGLPVISFRPIAGHGKENTAEMQDAGVSRVARSSHQLLSFLDQMTTAGPARQAMVAAGRAMFVADPARYVEYAAIVGAAGLNDRELLDAVGAGWAAAGLGASVLGLDDLDLAQLAGGADGVEFDPANELRDLLAGTGSAGSAAADADVSTDTGRLAPIVPIRSRRAADRRGERAVAEANGTEPAEVVPMRPPVSGRDGDESESESGDELEPTGTDGTAAPPRRRPRRPSVAVARFAAVVAAVPLIWAALTSGVAFATSYGAGVAHPASNSGNVAYIGVRLGGSELNDPVITQQLEALHATAVVDEQTAASDPTEVHHLVSLGINVENGGAGYRVDSQGHRIDRAPWTRADGDVAASQFLARISGQPVKVFVPGRRLNAFDLMACYGAHTKTVVPDRIFDAADPDPLPTLGAHHTYLVNGADATAGQMQSMLSQVTTTLAAAGLSGAPLADLV